MVCWDPRFSKTVIMFMIVIMHVVVTLIVFRTLIVAFDGLAEPLEVTTLGIESSPCRDH